jgi:hypothetical protein
MLAGLKLELNSAEKGQLNPVELDYHLVTREVQFPII